MEQHSEAHPIIELESVAFAYDGEPAVTDVTLAVHAGDYMGIIGPNGGGKTTLLKLMLKLLEPQQGAITMFGQPMDDFKDWSRVGYVPQKVTNLEARLPMSVEEVVLLGRVQKRGLFKRLNANDKAKAHAALAKVGLHNYARRQINELSGGQQQRVFIAKALASEPEVLLLDEPTVGIDARSQAEFYELLDQLNRGGITMVMVSHDIDVMVKEVNHLVWVNEKVAYNGVPQDFKPDEYLKSLYGKGRQFIRHAH